MIDAQLVQQRRVQIVHVDFAVDRLKSDFISRTETETIAESTSG